MGFHKPEQFPTGSPSQDHSDRHEDDRILRRYGYRIAERLNDSEAIWERNGKLYTQSTALAMIASSINRG